MKRVLHLITGLNRGGAETVLYQLLKNQISKNIEYKVISLSRSGYYASMIRILDIPVIEVEIKRHPIKAVREIYCSMCNADSVLCWMYHSNLVGFVIGKIAHVPNIIWSVHHSNLDKQANKSSTLLVNKICAKLSKKVKAVVYTGSSARKVHEAVGYDRTKSVIIDNGCSSTEYCYVQGARNDLIKELGITSENEIIISIARNHPIKDIPNFINAFGLARRRNKKIIAVMCGLGVDNQNVNFREIAIRNNLVVDKDIFFLGLRDDIARLLSASDLYVLHSKGEAFPMTLIQAMLCECVCVATDVGDVHSMMNQEDCIVPPCNSNMLCEKICEILSLTVYERELRGKSNRSRAIEKYDIIRSVSDYENLF